MRAIEKRGNHIGIKFTLPTIQGQKVELFRHTYEIRFRTDAEYKRLKAEYERDKFPKFDREIDNCDGEALFRRFPECEPLIAELRRRGWLKVSVQTTVKDLLQNAIKYWTEEDVRSLEDKQSKVNMVDEEFPGTRLAHQVTADDIEAYKKRLLEAGYKPQTVKHRLQTLQMAFKLGKLAEKVEKVPYFKMPKVDNEERTDAYYENEEIEVLVPCLPEHVQGLVKVDRICGWRLSELTSRQLKDILVEVYPDGIRGEFLHLDGANAKNGEERDFPLNIPGMREALDEQIAYVRRLERKLRRIIPLLFPNEKGEPIKDFYWAWDTAVRKSGIEVVNPETGKKRRRLFRHLRNTAITNLLDMRVPVHMEMNLVGHKTVTVADSSGAQTIVSSRDMPSRYHQQRRRKMWDIGDRVAELMAARPARKPGAVIHSLDHGLDLSRTSLDHVGTTDLGKNGKSQ